MTFFRCFLGVFVFSLLAGHSGWTNAQTYPSHRIYRHLTGMLQPHVPPLPSRGVQQQPPQQASYASDALNVHAPKRLQIPASQQSYASIELHQPWNLNEFPVRQSSSLSPYRLVSDTQAVTKTPPPAGGLQHLLDAQSPVDQTVTVPVSLVKTPPTKPAAPVTRSLPILGIGRDLLNEFRPSNQRQWSQNHAVLQTATIKDKLVTIHNVRYSRYVSADSYTTQYYDATFNLDDIRTIDLVMVPFQGLSRLAHVESSFGFADGRQIGLSIEARYEENEKYDPAAAGLRQFELIYVFADERDMIRLGTDVNRNDVYLYRLNFEPGEVRTMFVDALTRANKLATQPEFYHPLTNSCITNLIAHMNKGRSQSVPREYRTFMPGLFDNYLYDLKLMTTTAKTFNEARNRAKVNWLVERYGDLEYFSAGIRQNMY